MIHPLLEDDAWCYWVVSVGALLSFLGLVVACICSCRRNENKNEFLGLDGMVTLNNSENDGFNRIPTTDGPRIGTQDAIDSAKRATGANRSLPDIPKDKGKRYEDAAEFVSQDIYETTETIGDQSELYATVQDTAAEEQMPEQGMQEVLHQNSLIQENSVHQYTRFPSTASDNVEHPYAQLQNVQKSETGQLNRNTVKQATDIEKPSTSMNPVNGNPIAPPRTRKSSSHNSLLSNDSAAPCDIQAANAISGGIQANQDLPYMTPPLLMLLPQSPQPQSNSPQQHFSGDSQDSKGYTSISVREPLANIIAQTKTMSRQNQPTRPLTDPHYATVSDDSDEMYAAIDEQDKVYTSGSETYAQIQPMITEVQRVVQSEQTFSRSPSRSDEVHPAPQPPSVDSLRHVAHAHSRQASSSSANSSIINPGSPKPEKRQANSPLPPPPEGTTDVYASIEKRTKTDDRSKSSLSSGKSLEDMYAKVMKKKKDVEEQNDVHAISHGAVHPDVVAPCRKLSLIDINRTSWSSHDSMEVQRQENYDSVHYPMLNGSASNHQPEAELLKFLRVCDGSAEAEAEVDADRDGDGDGDGDEHGHGDEDGDGDVNGDGDGDEDADGVADAITNKSTSNFGYDPVASDLAKKNPSIRTPSDPSYEVLRSQRQRNNAADHSMKSSTDSVPAAGRNSTDLTIACPVTFKHRQVSNASSEDPGYEKVRLRRRIMDVDQDTDSEPNYESMPHDSGEPNYASVCRPGDSDTDPNYESVNHGDPNYESVKYMSVTRNEEPPYEQVNAYKPESALDGYEKVTKQLFSTDYEQIYLDRTSDPPISNGDTDDEQYVQV